MDGSGGAPALPSVILWHDETPLIWHNAAKAISGASPTDIDLIIVATTTPDNTFRQQPQKCSI